MSRRSDQVLTMTVELHPLEVNRGEAASWLKESLKQGFDLSSAVLASKLLDRGAFLVFAPGGFDRSPMKCSAGGVTRRKCSEKALSKFLNEASEEGAMSVTGNFDQGEPD